MAQTTDVIDARPDEALIQRGRQVLTARNDGVFVDLFVDDEGEGHPISIRGQIPRSVYSGLILSAMIGAQATASMDDVSILAMPYQDNVRLQFTKSGPYHTQVYILQFDPANFHPY
ncbi:hypothetical protein J4460_05400 [Candidatus Woesearchaeota archaeon]|nr:hypothetical protein [Candidatus Woesearchaeota archaeon]HIH38133.1 hypothetical protein [Candidatus Woesearchaeota archaeon]HIH49582.1 hypothetical protein [Candidatus Woesearchaeota archaeon]HIJ04392.1 hypothetical protein [Candidatus Woesearchaeota archaeon]